MPADLLKRLAGRPLPAWAAEVGSTTFSQRLLEFVLSNPSETCAIPGTGNAQHMLENAAADTAALPDPTFWAKHADLVLR